MMTEYKETPIGNMPREWEVRKVRDLFEVETGTTPSTKEPKYWKGGTINWLTPTDLSKLNGTIYVTKSERKITDEAVKEFNLTLIPRGSIIISTRAPVGYVAVLKEAATFNQGCKGLIPKYPNEICSEFYCYYLLSKKQMLENLSGGSTFKELSKKKLEVLDIPFPPFTEQQRIAEVLSGVDDAIRRVDLAIVKTERLKKGLMQKLLTEGIGHKEFKETKIGKIPKTWKVVKLGEITKVTVGYVGPISKYYTTKENGVPLLSTTNISEDGIRLNDLKYVTQKFYNKNKKVQVFPGDILIARHGESGSAAAVPKNIKKACCLNVVIVRKSERFIPRFVEYLFNFQHTKIRLMGWKSGSVQGVVNTRVLEKFKIPLPSLQEQQKIASILSIIDNKIKLEKERKERLVRIKKGLMVDLLSGRRRVKVAM